jgi:peptide/nickel transport system ATP-binding protein/oligopeptide transport system ATP-binding protein
VVEEAPVRRLFEDPQHPYTIGLLGSIPKLHLDEDRLATVEGSVPSPYAKLEGCRFHPRCPFAQETCRAEQPELREVAPGHRVACIRAPLQVVP